MNRERHTAGGRGAGPGRAGEPPPHRPGGRARARVWRAVAFGALALAAAVIAALLWGRRENRLGSSPAIAPADTMAITVAYTEAARLAQAGRFVASLPYYRRVGRLLPQPVRDYELLVAHALGQAALESRQDAAQPASRSSVERVGWVGEALAHLERARALSHAAREVAEVEVTRAQLLHVWGFPWEALLGLRAAVAADPSWTEIAQTGDLYAWHLHHPAEKIQGVDFDTMLEPAPGGRAAPARAARPR